MDAVEMLAEFASNSWFVWPVKPFYLFDSPNLRVRAAVQGADSLEIGIRTVLSMLKTAKRRDAPPGGCSRSHHDAFLWYRLRYSECSNNIPVQDAPAREGLIFAIHVNGDSITVWKSERCRARLYIADNFGDNESTFHCKRLNNHDGDHAYWFTRGQKKDVFIQWEHDEFFERWIDDVNMDLDRDLEQISLEDPNRVCFIREDGSIPCAFGAEDEEAYRSGQRKATAVLNDSTCYFCRQLA